MDDEKLYRRPEQPPKGELKPGQQGEHPARRTQREKQQRRNDRRGRQHGPRFLNGPSNLRPAPQRRGDHRSPQQGGQAPRFQLSPEGPEKPGVGPRLVPADAVDGGVIEGGGGRAGGYCRQAAEKPQDAQDHHVQDPAAPAPEKGVWVEQVPHLQQGGD